MKTVMQDVEMVQSLLGREVPELPALARHELAGKVVMVTGGGGSIGSALCLELAACRVSKLIVVDNSEFNLYVVDHLLERDHPTCSVISVLADVTCYKSLELVFKTYDIDYVFHAAAHKHVPMVEKNPIRGLLVNVIGTEIVLDLSVQYGVANFLLVSTDKAVNPTNVMGASKRIAESVVTRNIKSSMASNLKVKVVRFGNVLWSSGSVLPLFHSQLTSGKPVTLTDTKVTRYFMSVREAVQLILRATVLDESGIYVFDMGEPIRIRDMIHRLAEWCGVKNYEVKITGLRHGEKLYEELTLGLGLVPTADPKIKLAKEEPLVLPGNTFYRLKELIHGSRNLLEIRALLLDMGFGYAPESPIVDPVWLSSQVKQVTEVHGDSNEFLWVSECL